MLFKKIITQYGASLSGPPRRPEDDLIYAALVHTTGETRDMLSFRKDALDAMKIAKPFFLDHNAADYIDSIADTMGKTKVAVDPEYMREIQLPEDVVWVEYDAKALAYAMRERKSHNRTPLDEIEDLNLRGALFDNRDPEFLRCFVFKTHKGGGIIDPLVMSSFEKNAAGYPKSSVCRTIATPHMVRFFQNAAPDQLTQDTFGFENSGLVHLYMMSFALFATIKSMNGDISLSQGETFTSSERKTARKFGKTHITDVKKSHITIRLDEPGMAYIRQLRDDESDRKLQASGRETPVRHTVREHERRYKSGKIVMVKSFARGTDPDTRPTRVTARKLDGDDGPSLF